MEQWSLDYKYNQHHSNITMPCRFRPRGVFCDKFSGCGRCGWNPDVEARRKEKLHENDEPPKEEPISFMLGGGTFESL